MLDLSKICRLCSTELTYGIDIFLGNDEQQSLSIFINKYLPIKVIEDNFLPRKICETCHICCASTIDFIDRLVKGQLKLGDCIKNSTIQQNEQFSLQHVEVSNVDNGMAGLELEKQVINLGLQQVYASDELVNMQGDLSNVVMKDVSKGSSTEVVYESQQIGNSVQNLQSKKGRPRKHKREISTCDVYMDRPKRRICAPSRYKDSFAGRDFDEILSDKEDSMTLERLEDGTAQLNTLFDGTTVIVTQNGEEEHAKLPAEVNIELNFKPDTSNIEHGVECHIPTASVSGVKIVVPPQINRSLSNERYKCRKTDQRKWFCDICNKSFRYKGRYLIHLSTHENFTFQCKECKERFSFKQELKTHQESVAHQGIGIIEDSKDVKCDLCPDMIFQTSEAVMKHRSDIHNIRKKQRPRPQGAKSFDHSQTYTCNICRKIFKRKSSLLLHQDRAHTDNPTFVCSICSKEFAHRQLLQKHRAELHSEERPYSCEVCSFKFKTKVTLVSHQAIHSNVKRYTCEICGKILNHLTSLTHHLQSHQGVKPHTCSYCNKSFTQKGNLLEHERTHTGEKPFSCVVCQRAFKTSSQVSQHTKQHFRVTYKCHVCERTFLKEEVLTKHFETHCDPKQPEPSVMPVPTINDCLNNVQIPMVESLLIPDVMPDPSTAFTKPETLSFDSNPHDSSVIYIISKKEYQQLQFDNLEDEVRKIIHAVKVYMN